MKFIPYFNFIDLIRSGSDMCLIRMFHVVLLFFFVCGRCVGTWSRVSTWKRSLELFRLVTWVLPISISPVFFHARYFLLPSYLSRCREPAWERSDTISGGKIRFSGRQGSFCALSVPYSFPSDLIERVRFTFSHWPVSGSPIDNTHQVGRF